MGKGVRALAAVAVLAGALFAPLAGSAGASGPSQGLVSAVTGTSSNFYWFNGSQTTNGNGQWVGYATFKNDWMRHQYLDIKVVRNFANGAHTTETVSSFYVPANGTSNLAVWTNDLAVEGGSLVGVTSVTVTVKKVTTSDANWQPYSGNVSGPSATIYSPLSSAPPTTTTTSTTTTSTTTTTTPPADPGLVSTITGVTSNFYWFNGSTTTNGNGQWVGYATFKNDWMRHQYLDIKVVKNFANGSQTTENVSSFYVPANGTADLAVWGNDLEVDNGSLVGVVDVVVTVTKVTTSDVNWQPYSGNVSGPSATIPSPLTGGSGTTTTTTVPGTDCGDYTPTQLAVSPTIVSPEDVVTITGIAKPGDIVSATLKKNASTYIPLGSDTADGSGAFEIEGVIPAGLAPGTYTIKVSSSLCPSDASVSVLVSPPKMSGCGYDNEARTFFPGQTVIWTLHDSSFDTNKPVQLKLNKKQGPAYTANLYGSAPWPGSNKVTFTVPLDAPLSNKYEVEQIGSQKNKNKTMTKTCPVTIEAAPTPAAAVALEEQAVRLPVVALVVGAISVGTLFRLRMRRGRTA